MNRFFYAKLALTNLKKNTQLYIPYILTAIGMICVFYTLNAITRDEGVLKMTGGAELKVILSLGSVVIGIFSTIFLFYTNSFLIKRRKKEFGLFNILGMEKRHIGRMMFTETVFVSGTCLVLGFLTGIILYKAILMLLLRITNLKTPFGFQISFGALFTGLMLFGGIFVLTLLYNLRQVQLSKPIELLQSKNHGEKEPKTKWLITIIGVITLGAGYYIAITTKSPLAAIFLFFIAVLLVMIGTYCLFTAGSIALLKVLKKNKKYFYKTKHFISVSGMIYRMKQNAVGLANICILSSAVLVMISGTVSLYAGSKEILDTISPADINFTFYNLPREEQDHVQSVIKDTIKEQGMEVTGFSTSRYFQIYGTKEGENVILEEHYYGTDMDISQFYIVAMEDYMFQDDIKEDLNEDEVLVYVMRGDNKDSELHFSDRSFKIKSYLKSLEFNGQAQMTPYDTYFIIVRDENTLQYFYDLQEKEYENNKSSIGYDVLLNVEGSDQEKRDCLARLNQVLAPYDEGDTHYYVNDRISMKANMDLLYGGFLFLGIFLGFVFLMATVLIIYYKQVSEGYEDKQRFEIMQKVGLSKKEVRQSIKSQIIKVFFMPLLTAVFHLAAAFPLIVRLIGLFNMNNINLIIACTLITVVVFIIIYFFIYLLTARVYYRIVNE